MASPQSTGSLAGIGSLATLAGGIIGGVGQIQAGDAAAQMYNYQAQLATINANTAKQNADFALTQGEISAVNYGKQAAQRAGAIVAAQASSGLDVKSGSAVDVQQSQQTATRIDLSQIRANAAKSAYDYEVQGTSFTNQATLDTAAAANSQWAGMIGAGSSMLGAAGSVSSKWLQAGQLGLSSGNDSSNAAWLGYNVTGLPSAII